MYVGLNIYERYPKYVKLSDIDFFKAALEQALAHYASAAGTDQIIDKSATPVCFCSTLAAQTSDETVVTRKQVHDKKRAKRRFLMLDADFNAQQAAESLALRERIREFAAAYHTPFLVYPTFSYPDKPRFRVVFFTMRALGASSYHKAILWLREQLAMTTGFDESDTNITANRNLPLFCNQEQVDNAEHTLDDQGLTLLDNSLWRDVKLPKRKTLTMYDSSLESLVDHLDEQALLTGARRITVTPICAHYVTFWRLVQSVALAVIDKLISEQTAFTLLDVFAQAGSDTVTRQRWQQGNRELYHKYYRSLADDAMERANTRPLYTYTEFKQAIRL